MSFAHFPWGKGIPLRQLINTGIPVAQGTDSVPHSMLWTMWEALVRWDEDSRSRLGQSQLTREEALRFATQNGHLLTWNEDRFGSLEAGKMADLVVLGDNPLTCPKDQIKDIPWILPLLEVRKMTSEVHPILQRLEAGMRQKGVVGHDLNFSHCGAPLPNLYMKRWGGLFYVGILSRAFDLLVHSEEMGYLCPDRQSTYGHCTYSAVSHVNVRRTLLLKTVKSKL